MRTHPMRDLRSPVSTYGPFGGYVFHVFSQTNVVWTEQNVATLIAKLTWPKAGNKCLEGLQCGT